MEYWFIQSTVACSLKITLFITKKEQSSRASTFSLLQGAWVYLPKVKSKLRSVDESFKKTAKLAEPSAERSVLGLGEAPRDSQSRVSDRLGPLRRVLLAEAWLWDAKGSSPLGTGDVWVPQARGSRPGHSRWALLGPRRGWPAAPCPRPHVDSSVLSGNRLWLAGVEK